MSEELKQEGLVPEVKQEEVKQEREYSSIEIKAIEQGWIPKEEFDGDESEFIDAPEFVRRGELFGKIETQSKEIKNMRNALKALSDHYSKVKEMEYERALRSLKDARRAATIEGDHEKALALEDKIDEVKAEKERIVEEAKQTTQVEETSEVSPEFASWLNRNSWYEDSTVMRAAADTIGKQLHSQGYSPAEVLVMVEKEIRKEFSHKFTKTAARPSPVEGTTRSGSKKDDFVMTPEERDMMRKIVQVTPNFTEADYIRDLKALKSR
jgi:hypothetical protein